MSLKYKVLFVKNRYPKKLNVDKYAKDWFNKNLPIEIITEEISTDFDVTTEKVTNGTFTGCIVDKEIIPKLQSVIPEGKYNAIVLVYGNALTGVRVSCCNGAGGQFPLYPDTELIQVAKVEDGGKTINHELFHGFFYKAHKCQINIQDNIDTYYNDNDLKVDEIINTNREVALKSLAPYWKQICDFRKIQTPNVVSISPKIDTNYKYFTSKEVEGLKPEFVQLLDKMREECGFPFKINSGYRSKIHNALVGGVNDSAHTCGEAVDISISDSAKRFKFIQIALKNNINRVGISKDFIHIDISKTLLQNCLWLY